MFLGLIIIRIILFLPSFLCPCCKFIPKLCQKYRSPFKTSERIHHQFHFFSLETSFQSPISLLDLLLLTDAAPLLSVLPRGHVWGGPCSTYRSEICSAFRDTGNSTSPALVPPPPFVYQQLLECVAVKMQPRILVFWFTNYFISLFKSQKSVFPFYKEKNQSRENINILCKIPEGKFQSHF